MDFEDRSRATAFRTRLAPINFELRDFATTGKAGNTYSLRAASVDDERFGWDGSFETTPFTSHGQFEITNLHATTLWSYLRDALPFELTTGMINLSGGYEFAARDSGLKLNVKNVSATDISLHGPGQPVDDVKLAQLQITNTRFDLRQRRVDVEKLSLSGAALRARRDRQGAINLLALLGEDEAPPAGTAAADTAPRHPRRHRPGSLNAPDISIEGVVDVEDALVYPAATFKLAPVDPEARGLQQCAGHAACRSTRTSASTAMRSSRQRAKWCRIPRPIAVHVDLNDFKLPSMQPYLGAYTQMTLSSGKLSAALDVRRAERAPSTIAGSVDVAKLHTIDNALRPGIHQLGPAASLRHRIHLATAEAAHRDHRGQFAVRAPDHCAGPDRPTSARC